MGRSTINAYLSTLKPLARYAEDRGKSLELLEQDDLELFLATRRHLSNGTQNNGASAIKQFYRFLKKTGRRPDDPSAGLSFKTLPKPQKQERAVGQISQKLAKLSPHHRELALFSIELLRAGASLQEIFGIDVEPPVPPEVLVMNGVDSQRYMRLSPEAQRRLGEWNGKPPIGLRAFQRALEKVGLSPKLLGERSRSAVDIELHPILESALHAQLAIRAFDEATAKTFFEVRQLLRQLQDNPDSDSAVNDAFLLDFPLEKYLAHEADAASFRMLLRGAVGLFGDQGSRARLSAGDDTVTKEMVLVGDMLVRVLERWREVRSLELVTDDYERAVLGLTESQLRLLGPLEFQNWVIQRFHGTLSPTFTGDMGIDGYTRFGDPVQVKRSDRVSRPEIDSFQTAVERTRKPKGYMVAFSFTDGAAEEARRASAAGKVDIRLVTVKELLEKVPL